MGTKFLIVLAIIVVAIIFGAIEATYFTVLNAYAAEDLVTASSPITAPHDLGNCTFNSSRNFYTLNLEKEAPDHNQEGVTDEFQEKW